ncbi:hypothetical protein P153DRAFT_359289 [Dothidotthia symphoricarpi CBS 119687]|uniref:Prolyl 4-hydroxylase alpha subunit Fe(2+) 2OG dioxygenase domain-containing protein n=1 Tax=Dothidotthia symphoricarpi CBS 119687 TaxID=1392245 RepID=A0A6A6A761_9PLEO|nr:uncharacterized protein P153DRAFT_359289 [Dothidotthia symphoricarpi CBS 119687]KAF2126973.1 hypothetical protein P153DRAFT_359289 [Dothidotthia symphoricarpi CBS 119687]
MAPVEFYRYTDTRADTIIYKFDVDVLQNPSHYPRNESPISVYHHYRANYSYKYLLHSDLLPEELAIERWNKDQQPTANKLMHREEVSRESGMVIRTSYVRQIGKARGLSPECLVDTLPLLQWREVTMRYLESGYRFRIRVLITFFILLHPHSLKVLDGTDNQFQVWSNRSAATRLTIRKTKMHRLSNSDYVKYRLNSCFDSDGSDVEKDYKQRLQDCLDEIKYQGTFSAFQSHKQYVNPGLNRHSAGRTKHLSMRPSGKTWELDAAEFQFRLTHIHCVDANNLCALLRMDNVPRCLEQKAIQDLGVQVPTSALRYKVLFYEENAFFKAHRDTEKVPGVFGTLVINLPSEHASGDVYLVHGKTHEY